MPGLPGAALIGAIGRDSTDYFFIGDNHGPMRVPSSGRLLLRINHDYLTDYRGSFRATVFY